MWQRLGGGEGGVCQLSGGVRRLGGGEGGVWWLGGGEGGVGTCDSYG